MDKHSISPQTFDLAKKLDSKEITPEDLPPVKLVYNMNGSYTLLDGRHRVTAFKLLGLEQIKSKYYEQYTGT
ncbi:MAG: ParB/Srx family N-terminal domain-containing protein [Sphaerochaetaceae bacterium]|nr:ParB/Srx family N-terminal domain-containing protein [Sphaerochaetaceae bacterium]